MHQNWNSLCLDITCQDQPYSYINENKIQIKPIIFIHSRKQIFVTYTSKRAQWFLVCIGCTYIMNFVSIFDLNDVIWDCLDSHPLFECSAQKMDNGHGSDNSRKKRMSLSDYRKVTICSL